MTTTEKTAPEMVEIEHNGETYTIRKIDPKRPPVKVLSAIEKGLTVGALEAILGPVQWAKYLDTDPLSDDLEDLAKKCMGTDVGKSGT